MYLKIGNIKAQFNVTLVCMTLLTIVPCFCVKLKLFETNQRMSKVSFKKTSVSLAECSVLFINNEGMLSFSFNKDENICELSGNYPKDNSMMAAEGWAVYVSIGCTCYHWTTEDSEATGGDSSTLDDQLNRCENFHGFVFTEGNENRCPGCSGCWCCRP